MADLILVLSSLVFLAASVGAIAYILATNPPHAPPPTQHHILIVGASSGVGEQLAYEYAGKAHHLVLAARRLDRLTAVQGKCLSLGAASVHLIQTDITKDSDLRSLCNSVQGPLLMFVYTVGALNVCPFEATFTCTDSQATGLVNDMFRVNVTALILLTRLLLPSLRLAGGRIIVVTSVGALISAPSRALYCSAKAAIHGFFDAVRMEERRACPDRPVRVMLVAPGTIAGTHLRQSALDRFLWSDKFPTGSSSTTLTPQSVAKSIVEAHEDSELLVMPSFYRLAILVGFFFPNWIDMLAMRKYK